MKIRETIGKKFGRLTVLDEYPVRGAKRSRRVVKCLCDCGCVCTVDKWKVISGHTKSCGCYQRECCEKFVEGHRKEPGEAAFNEVYSVYQRGAARRGYPFELTKEQFREIVTQPCIYCGDTLTQTMRRKSNPHGTNGEFRYTGIDRYDNTLGYTLENSVSCCKQCNRIKTDMAASEFAERLERIVARRNIWERTA